MEATPDYYAILGLDKSADEKAIRKAYRDLARKKHPDVNPGDNSAKAKFQEINEAYEILGDADKRARYDRLRKQLDEQSQGRRGGQEPAAWAQYTPWDSATYEQSRKRTDDLKRQQEKDAETARLQRAEKERQERPQTLIRLYEDVLSRAPSIADLYSNLKAFQESLIQNDPDHVDLFKTLTADLPMLKKVATEFKKYGRGFLKKTDDEDLKGGGFSELFSDPNIAIHLESLYKRAMLDLLAWKPQAFYDANDRKKDEFESSADFVSFLKEDVGKEEIDKNYEVVDDSNPRSPKSEIVVLSGADVGSRIEAVLAIFSSTEFDWQDFASKQERNFGKVNWTSFFRKPIYRVIGDNNDKRLKGLHMDHSDNQIPVILRELAQREFVKKVNELILSAKTSDELRAYLTLITDSEIEGNPKTRQDTHVYIQKFDDLDKDNGHLWKGMQNKMRTGLFGQTQFIEKPEAENLAALKSKGIDNEVLARKMIEVLRYHLTSGENT